ncbi:SAV_2336 N-terminal domain-related protein [Spirillospora sp. CA-253888]
MTIERFRAVLASVGPDADAVELSELLWLARHLPAPAEPEPPPPPPAAAPPAQPPAPQEEERPPPEARPPEPPARPTTGLHAPAPRPRTGGGAREILVPTAPMLTDPLGVQRALRPLKRRVPSRLRRELDEDATATRIAETRSWVPVLVPSAERWLSLTLVMDIGPTMQLWRPLARELTEAMLRQGAFRDVRTAYLHPGGGVSATPTGARSDPGTLTDPSGRQVVLVLSDCSGPHWWDGDAPAAVRQWAVTGPTAILQPLPERMWRRTAVQAVPGTAALIRPGGPNMELRFAPYDGGPEPGLPVPVLEIAPRWFAGWAGLLAGGGPEPAAMADFAAVAQSAAPVRQEQRLPVEERVRRFLAAASPEAAELAAHVAVSVPSLPVMRLIQHRVLGASGPSQLAEVLLSGLLKPEEDRYEFVPGAREALLDTLPGPEAQHTRYVLKAVSAEIERRAGTATELFPALVGDEEGDRLLPAGTTAFAALSPEAQELLDRREGASGRAVVDGPEGVGSTRTTRLEELTEAAPFIIGTGSHGRKSMLPSPGTTVGTHGMILGTEGAGKTELLRTVLFRLTRTHTPGQLNIVLAAAEDSPLHTMTGLPHVFANLHERTGPDRTRTVVQSLEDRLAELSGSSPRPDSDHPRPSAWADPELTAPKLVMALDDTATLLDAQPDLAPLLERLLTGDAVPGVHVYLTGASLDFPAARALTPRLTWAVALRTASPLDQAAVLGIADPLPQPERPGDGWLRVKPGPVERFQADLVAPDTAAATPRSLFALLSLPDPLVSFHRFREELERVRTAPLPPIPIGTRAGTEPVALELGPEPGGVFVTGPAGSGRTELLRSLVVAISLVRFPQQAAVVLVARDSGALYYLARLPHVTHATTGSGESARSMAASLANEIERRNGLRADERAAEPRLFLIIDQGDDQVPQPSDERPRYGVFLQTLKQIAQQGPALGLHLVMGAGSEFSPESLDLAVKHHIALGRTPGQAVLLSATTPSVDFQTVTVDTTVLEMIQQAVPEDWARDLLTVNGHTAPQAFRNEWAGPPDRFRNPIIGRDVYQLPVKLNPLSHGSTGPHGLVVGDTGDRHAMVRSIVLALALAYPPEQLRVVCAGLGEHPLGPVDGLPHVVSSEAELLSRPRSLEDLTDGLRAEIDVRAVALREADHTTWGEHRELPALLVVVDLSLTLPSGQRDLVDLLVWIASSGRQLGVHLVVAASEVDRHPGWDRLFPLLSWRLSVGVLPPEQNRRLHGRARLPSAGVEGIGHLTAPGSGPMAFQMLRQPSDEDVAALVAQMVGEEPVPPPRPVADVVELNESAFGRQLGAPESGDGLLIGLNAGGEGVVLHPFAPSSGTGGLIVGHRVARTDMAAAIVLGLASRYSPEHVTFMIATAGGEGVSASISLLSHVTSLTIEVERRSARERFLAELTDELGQRENFQRRQVQPPSLFVVLHFPADLADAVQLGSLLEHFTPRSRDLGVHLLLVTDRIIEGRARDFVLGSPGWRIAVGAEPDSDLDDLFPAETIRRLAHGSACLWSRPTGFVTFSPALPPSTTMRPLQRSETPFPDFPLLAFADHPHLLVVGPPSSERTALFWALFRQTLRFGTLNTTTFAVLDMDGGLRGLFEDTRVEGGVSYASSPEHASQMVRSLRQQAYDRFPPTVLDEGPAPSFGGARAFFLFVMAHGEQEGPDPLETLLPLLGKASWSGLHVIVFRAPSPSDTSPGEVVQKLHDGGAPALFLASGHGAEADLWNASPPAADPPGQAVLSRRGQQQFIEFPVNDER